MMMISWVQICVVFFAWFILNHSFSIGTMGFVKILGFKPFKMLRHVRGGGGGERISDDPDLSRHHFLGRQ